jgi:hypothetical protein
MKKATGSALVWVAALSAAMLPMKAGAQSHAAGAGAATAQTAGEPTNAGGLAPSEIIASVRSAGFDPRSRPFQRGGVYFVFAVDRHSMDVRVTVDASSGRVLSATRLAGTRYGGPGYDGHEVLSRTYERPPVPPADIPNRGVARNAGVAPSSSPRAPLPRSRPGDVITETATEAPAQAAPRPAAPPGGLGDTTAEASPLPPSSATAPSAPPPTPSRPQPPTMVPIAPLE